MLGLLITRAEVLLLTQMLCGETQGMEVTRGARAAERERVVILQLVKTRMRTPGYPRTITGVVTAPGQFAAGCDRDPGRHTRRLVHRFFAGKVAAPRWARRALAFTTLKSWRRVRKAWARKGFCRIRDTDTVHVFYEKRQSCK